MRVAAAVSLSVVLIACSSQTASPPASPEVNRADTPAADLRTRLDLLLAEHVMIVAKETAAAVNHSEDYGGYTALLAANATDLAALMGRAFGTTAAAQFAQTWNAQNGYLVDYAIGVVTHNDDKANAAMSALNGTFVPQFAQMIDGWSGLSTSAVTQIFTRKIGLDKAFIDDVFAQKYGPFYTDLDKAYSASAELGDALALHVAQRFPDKFPGDSTAPAADTRVSVDLQMQEHSYLLTMATDATVAKRDADKTAAVSALAASSRQLNKAWADWDASLVAYATEGPPGPDQVLVDRLTSAMGAPRPSVQNLIAATVKVVDDQKAKSSRTLASDDRAAATAMQAIADSIKG